MQKNDEIRVDSGNERDIRNEKDVRIGANRERRRLGLIEVIVAAVTYLAAQVIGTFAAVVALRHVPATGEG